MVQKIYFYCKNFFFRMQIRKATLSDIDGIMCIFAIARQFMSDNGNTTQWVNGYPSASLISSALADNELHVCILEGKLVGTFCFGQGPDPNYTIIEGGAWINEQPYGVIHRLASAGTVKGLGSTVINWCFQQIPNLRVDTHRDNKVMQHLFEKLGFKYCGIIYVGDGTPRRAYQKTA